MPTPPPPSGVIVPIVTPFTRNGTVDWPSYGKLIEHVVTGGVDAVFVLGTTGEGPSLGAAERRSLVKYTCEKVGRRCPVYVGVIDTSLSESLRLAEFSRTCGADAAAIVPSPYFPVGVREQIAFFRAFVDGSDLPVLLYNIPQMTKTAIAPEAFDALVDDPRIVGLKDSSGNRVYFRRLQHIASRRPDFAMLTGSEELLAESVLTGASGGVTGGANFFPELYRRLFIASRDRDFAALEPLQKRVMELSCKLYSYGNGGYTVAGVKALLNAKGLCEPWVLPPLLPANAELTEIARELLEAVRN